MQNFALYPMLFIRRQLKRVKELEGEGEMIYNFIRDEHRVRSEFTLEQQNTHITDDIDKWISNTFKKHGVNIISFCNDWCMYFSNTPNLWEKSRKIEIHKYDSLLEYKDYDLSSYMFWEYDYEATGERFGLNPLYRNMPKKDFYKEGKNKLSKR